MDIEQLVLLKENLEILADGRDPKTGYQVDDTILKSKLNKQILKDAADILDVLLKIDFNPVKIDRRKKYTFFMSEETKKKIEISSIPISISMFTYRINQHINSNKMKKIKASQITNWLMSKGFLNEIESEDGKKFKILTDKSDMIGISSEQRKSKYGREYGVNLYDEKAQRFIIDHLDEIVNTEINII